MRYASCMSSNFKKYCYKLVPNIKYFGNTRNTRNTGNTRKIKSGPGCNKVLLIQFLQCDVSGFLQGCFPLEQLETQLTITSLFDLK